MTTLETDTMTLVVKITNTQKGGSHVARVTHVQPDGTRDGKLLKGGESVDITLVGGSTLKVSEALEDAPVQETRTETVTLNAKGFDASDK